MVKKAILALIVYIAPLFLFSAAVALASGYSGSGVSLPVSVPNGGTGSATGAGLVGAYGTANDTSGTVNLTATSARTRLFDQGESALTYNLPLASDMPNGVFWFRSVGTGGGNLTIAPQTADSIAGASAGTAYTQTNLFTTNYSAALISDGGTRWSWYILPTSALGVITGNGLLVNTATGLIQKTTSAGASLTSATSLTAVGALATGSIASGFGTIATGNTIATTSTVSADSGYLLPPQTAPGNPASGWVLYTDTADGTLKAKDSAGTVRDIALP